MHFYQQSPQELDPDEPLGICTTTFTNPPTQEQHFFTKKLSLGQQLVQIKAHITMHSIPWHFQISITFLLVLLKYFFYRIVILKVENHKSHATLTYVPRVNPQGQ